MPRYAILTWSEVEEKENSTPGFFFSIPTPPWVQSGQKPANGARTKPHFQDHTVPFTWVLKHLANTTWTCWKSLKEINAGQRSHSAGVLKIDGYVTDITKSTFKLKFLARLNARIYKRTMICYVFYRCACPKLVSSPFDLHIRGSVNVRLDRQSSSAARKRLYMLVKSHLSRR